MNSKNILIFGLGMMSQRYLRILKNKFPNNNYFVIRNSKKNIFLPDNKNMKFKKQNLYKIYNIKEVKIDEIKKINPYFCVISDFEDGRLNKIKKILNCKSHIFCEKPLNDKVIDKIIIKEINNKILNNKLSFSSSFLDSYHPVTIALEKILRKNMNIIKIEVTNSENISDVIGYKRRTNTKHFDKKLSKSILVQQIHDFYFFYRIFGLPKTKYINNYKEKKTVHKKSLFLSTFIGFYEKYNFELVIQNSFLSKKKERSYKIYRKNDVIYTDLVNNSICVEQYTGKRIFFKKFKVDRLKLFEKILMKFVSNIKQGKHTNNFFEFAESFNYIMKNANK